MIPEAPPHQFDGNALPVSPTLARAPRGVLGRRDLLICGLAVILGGAAVLVAKTLVLLIALVTNLSFFGRLSFAPADPSKNHLGAWVIVVPAIGGLIVGLMAKYGSRAIRGHGIPEAMEQVLTNGSRIPPRITILKPTSSAIAIGTGGPFGAEGPIIATGGALGSLVGQLLHTTAVERKTLLSAGAAAGMTAIFASPVAAVVLAVELLLFELRPRTLVPVALACASAAGLRTLLMEPGPVFAMAAPAAPSATEILVYGGLGLFIGLVATGISRLVYAIEDAFEHLPIHWAFWPALGGLVVGLVGFFAPRTLGVGYSNISDLLNGRLVGTALLVLFVAKFVSWSISLGSGTSGGTLAPLMTIGGGLGAVLGGVVAPCLPIDPRVAGLVGMAAMFAGASRAMLTSVVFALETTGQPNTLAPLLVGCAAAYLVSAMLGHTTIMTEKIVRRGIRVPSEYVADVLAGTMVGRKPVVSLDAAQSLNEVRAWLATTPHQGFPVLDEAGRLRGVVTRRDLLDLSSNAATVGELIRRPAETVAEGATMREAADRMLRAKVGRLPVVAADGSVVGLVTRGDLLAAHAPRLQEHERRERTIGGRRVEVG